VGPCPEGHRGRKGLVGHAGAILLRKAGDATGLTSLLSTALEEKGRSPLLDRGTVLVLMAASIALGATSMSDIALLRHLAPLMGGAPSGPTARRALEQAGSERALDRIARARARARARAWELIEVTPAGFPWLEVAGKALTGWMVTDMDATLITAHSDKDGDVPRCARAASSPAVRPLWSASLRSKIAPACPTSPFPSAVTSRAWSQDVSFIAKSAPVWNLLSVVTGNLPGPGRSSPAKDQEQQKEGGGAGGAAPPPKG
jgi:hypothetical protein